MHKKLLPLFLLIISIQHFAVSIFFDPKLSLAQDNKNVVIKFKDQFRGLVENIASKSYESRGARIFAIASAKEEATKKYQEPVAAILTENKIEYEAFYIMNVICVKLLTPGVLLILSLLRLIISSIILAPVFFPSLPIPGECVPFLNSSGLYGLKSIGATFFHENEIQGKGAVVSSIDSGVDASHPDLIGQRIPCDQASCTGLLKLVTSCLPFDFDLINGHGTHTMGTMVGKKTGVAPEARWLACVGCPFGFCPFLFLLRCFQCLLCPNRNPTNPRDRCSLAPTVINNSWGGAGGDDTYNEAIWFLIICRIFPFFASGNSGPNCGTANSPGDNGMVISVGAHGNNPSPGVPVDVADFSSRGPVVNASQFMIKPNIVAPGVNTASTCPFQICFGTYQTLSGTSMATPHVAGGFALLCSVFPERYWKEMYILLMFTALKAPEFITCLTPPSVCNGISNSITPNYCIGWGKFHLIRAAQIFCKYDENFKTLRVCEVVRDIVIQL